MDDDLVRDITEVLTLMCARLYGRRSARRRAESGVGRRRGAGLMSTALGVRLPRWDRGEFEGRAIAHARELGDRAPVLRLVDWRC